MKRFSNILPGGYHSHMRFWDSVSSTSEALKLFNDIFASVNGTVVNKKPLCEDHEDSEETNVYSNSPLRTAITDSSLHHTFWPEAKKKT